MIAMALACEPKLLIADEPTTALDVTIQAQILDLLRALVDERGMALILITHDLGVVAGMCERVNVMYGGTFMESGSADQLFARPRHPYTLGLLQSVPRLDASQRGPLTPIHGAPRDMLTPPRSCPFQPRCRYAVDESCEDEFRHSRRSSPATSSHASTRCRPTSGRQAERHSRDERGRRDAERTARRGRGSQGLVPDQERARAGQARRGRARGRRRLVLDSAWRDARPRRRVRLREVDARARDSAASTGRPRGRSASTART